MVRLKGRLNASTGKGFTLSENLNTSGVDAALRETETTITVNWTGGGEAYLSQRCGIRNHGQSCAAEACATGDGARYQPVVLFVRVSKPS